MERVLFRLHPGHLPAGGQAVPQLAPTDSLVRGQLADWKQRSASVPKVSLRCSWMPLPISTRRDSATEGGGGLNGMQPADVRVEFVARRLLPEPIWARPAVRVCSR